MEQFDALLQVAQKLLGPQGCPWDQGQTFLSLQAYVLEEAHEVIEAVDLHDDSRIVEELGDLLYTVIFYALVGEKEKRFSLIEILNGIREKLIRRHPHIFGNVKVAGIDDIVANWSKIKAEEKALQKGESTIPQTLPLLARGQKMLKKKLHTLASAPKEAMTEEELGEKLVALLVAATRNELDAEGALRRALQRLEALS